jgi:hypothetical protein
MHTHTIRFNPTAVAVHSTGDNAEEVKTILEEQTGAAYSGHVLPGTYYVAFMGTVFPMTERQFQSAQGLL